MLIVLGIMLCVIEKGELHLLLTFHRSAGMDFICRSYTYVGAWVPYVVIAGLLFWRFSASIYMLFNMLTTTIVVQVTKHLVTASRPLKWFAENMPDVKLNLVEGVKMNMLNSFPSGHTTTFFILFISLCIIFDFHQNGNKKGLSILIGIFAFVLAAFGAYTRIYLHQHFALDIFAGISIALICSLYGAKIYAWLSGRIGEKSLLNQ